MGLSEEGKPYVVPLVFGYDNGCVYFHSAQEGKKIDMLRRNKNVCLEFDKVYGVEKDKDFCNWDVKYESVICFGKAHLIKDDRKKKEALAIIADHCTEKGGTQNHHQEYPQERITDVEIIAVKIEEMTGKRSRL